MTQTELFEGFSSSKQRSSRPLGPLLKSVRDIMRKDKGLNGDLDRIPMLTWIMFLKFLDDQEHIREAEAKLAGGRFAPIIDSPYRWRDWAAKSEGITGPELLAFVNQDEAVRPDGTRGQGLFAYLRSLSSSDGRSKRDVVATVFRGTVNRMINGYLLRDVINRVNEIHFDTMAEIHSLAFLYESLLKEMRDAAGDSGEFYTPRPVIRFMVKHVNPQLGEVVLDPAAGTGGFLVEAFKHLSEQCKKAEDYQRLQNGTLYGFEAKPMPFLLCLMNMLLHGIETPEIDSGNALRFPIREIGEKDRVDVILTNPPFGGEEEKGILSNFPEDKRTAETALLFLQLIMRKLRRSLKPGRAGVVVPDGVLFGDGVCARIKEELVKEFNLHTIVRLPVGVFSPYADIAPNLLFFERTGPTRVIWFYELPLPSSRKRYTKTKPLQYEEFGECNEWWNNRSENDHAWRVDPKEVMKYDDTGNIVALDLDIKNPKHGEDAKLLPPKQIVDGIIDKEKQINGILTDIEESLASGRSTNKFSKVPLVDIVAPVKRQESVVPGKMYRQVGVRLWGGGAYERPSIDGSGTRYEYLYRVEKDDIIVNKIWARSGSAAVISESLAGCYASSEFPTFVPLKERLNPIWFSWFAKTRDFWKQCEEKSRGTGGKNRIRPERFLEIEVPLPSIPEQQRILLLLEEVIAKKNKVKALQDDAILALKAFDSSVLIKCFNGEM